MATTCWWCWALSLLISLTSSLTSRSCKSIFKLFKMKTLKLMAVWRICVDLKTEIQIKIVQAKRVAAKPNWEAEGGGLLPEQMKRWRTQQLVGQAVTRKTKITSKRKMKRRRKRAKMKRRITSLKWFRNSCRVHKRCGIISLKVTGS